MSLQIERTEVERKPMLGAIKSAIFGSVPAVVGKKVIAVETPHQRVFRLIGERRIEDAARLAARLINGGESGGFFVYGGTQQYHRAEAWHAERVQSGKRGQVCTIETITPEVAQVLLTNNDGNRRVNALALSNIIRDILSGNWELNGETFKVSKEGLLNDSQHRNFGVLLSGQSIKTYIAFGVLRDTMKSVDIGRKRTAADRLNIRGEGEYTSYSAISSLAFELDSGRQGTAAEVDAYFSDHADEIRAAFASTGASIRGVGPSITGTVALHLVRLGAKPADVKKFLKVVRDNEGTVSGDAARTIHRALFPNTGKPPLKMKKLEWVSTLCNHFVAWRRSKPARNPLVDLPLPEAI